MISPLSLSRSKFEFSPMDQDLIRDHLSIFQRNGFDFVEVEAPGPDGRLCSELSLSAVPYSKSLVLGIEDVSEMLEMIKGGERVSDIRPSKVKTMIASRACRSSIMVGRGLGEGSMRRVLRGMEALDNPWCCAHGRPTLRHVCALPNCKEATNS